jgi:hypothetical protein
MVQIKNNLAAFGHSKAFELSESGFSWIGDYEITADEVLGGIAPKVNKQDRATALLKELAENHKMLPSKEIEEAAREENISKRTLENAKQSLGIKEKRSTIPGTGSLRKTRNKEERNNAMCQDLRT